MPWEVFDVDVSSDYTTKRQVGGEVLDARREHEARFPVACNLDCRADNPSSTRPVAETTRTASSGVASMTSGGGEASSTRPSSRMRLASRTRNFALP